MTRTPTSFHAGREYLERPRHDGVRDLLHSRVVSSNADSRAVLGADLVVDDLGELTHDA